MTDGDSGTAALTEENPTPTNSLESALPIVEGQPVIAQLSPLQAAQTAAHWNGLHMAYADIHCPVCKDLGYVGDGYDRERLSTGSAQ